MPRLLVSIALALAIFLAGAFMVFRTPDTDAAAMQAKYGGALARYAETAEARIHYRDQGPRDAPVLLLIHGSNASLQVWEPTVARLDDRYRLISFDLPSHGLTGPSRTHDYSADAMIRAAIAVLDDAGVERAVWVGNSYGGWVAWRAGLAAPRRVSGLVLVDAAGAQADPPVRLYLGARLMQSWLGRQLTPSITPRSFVRASIEQTYSNPERVSEALVTRYWELLRYPGNRSAAAKRVATDREPDRWRDIGQLRTPVLVLWGAQDKTISPAHGNAFATAIPGAQLRLIPEAGHLPMEERPDAFAAELAAWLSGSDAVAASAPAEAKDSNQGARQ